ncbi:BT_3928 family protein [Flavisolibacter nicotianae]|uniref:BT_3928 family protein n=1 Tax=Flavisolibacter nicotianae TaxID=2364882 RepID=UPI000EB48C8D|nr:BT_3928 family protein [Flavisolibacter nicotianae]
MRTSVKIIQWLVGLLFIVSGLVKANDPVGLGYKMQEFFELWSTGLSKSSLPGTLLASLHDAALGLSIFMITLEILAGVALLIGWKKTFVLRLLLLLIIFFTFLTGYAYLSGKFTNCGCFGDCIPITPFTSFLKDLALLAMIVFLLVQQRYIQPVLSTRSGNIVLAATLFFSLGLQWYVLTYLPLADCLPFKKGAYLPAGMKPPPGAVPDSFAIRFVYEKGGKQYEFAPENLPADFTTYKFVDRKQTLVRKGNAEAQIKGFTLTNDEKDSISGNTIDFTDSVLAKPKALLVFALDFSDPEWIGQTKKLLDNAAKTGLPLYVVSPNAGEARAAFEKAGVTGGKFFNTDFTVVRTVARTNPTLLLLKNGTVEKKWSRQEMARAANELPAPTF